MLIGQSQCSLEGLDRLLVVALILLGFGIDQVVQGVLPNLWEKISNDNTAINEAIFFVTFPELLIALLAQIIVLNNLPIPSCQCPK